MINVTEDQMSRLCIREVTIVSVDSLEDNTVGVTCDGELFNDVPVTICTDYDCRTKIMDGTYDPTVDAYLFERSALHFIFPAGIDCYLWDTTTNGWDSTEEETVAPTAFAIAQHDENGNISDFVGVIHVKTHGIEDFDSCTKARPTYRVIICIHETTDDSVDEVERYILYDVVADEVAKIPNSTFTELVDADYATDLSEYDHFFSGPLPDELPALKMKVSTGVTYNSTNYSCQTTGWHAVFDFGSSNSCLNCSGSTTSPGWVGTSYPSGARDYTDECNDGFFIRSVGSVCDLGVKTTTVATEQELNCAYFWWASVEGDCPVGDYSGYFVDTGCTSKNYTLTIGGETIIQKNSINISSEKENITTEYWSNSNCTGSISLSTITDDYSFAYSSIVQIGDNTPTTTTFNLVYERERNYPSGGPYSGTSYEEYVTFYSDIVTQCNFATYDNFIFSFLYYPTWKFYKKREKTGTWSGGAWAYSEENFWTSFDYGGVKMFDENNAVQNSGLISYLDQRLQDFTNTLDISENPANFNYEIDLCFIAVPYNSKEAALS